MQQRYYDPLIGRFYSNDPVGFTPSNPMMFNRYAYAYAYANNNPYKFVDPDGRAIVYVWSKGPTATPGDNSTAGHITILTEGKDGAYLSMHPKSQRPFARAVFKTYEQDMAIYGREPAVIHLPLPDEQAAEDYANSIKSKLGKKWWTFFENCSDSVEKTINAGGIDTPKGDLINTPINVRNELKVVEVNGRVDSNRLKRESK